MVAVFISFSFIISGFWIYCSVREHLLSTLLSLEFMVLGIFFLLINGFFSSFYYYCFFYLIITACEGALGLSILVMMSRTHGGDFFNTLNFFNY